MGQGDIHAGRIPYCGAVSIRRKGELPKNERDKLNFEYLANIILFFIEKVFEDPRVLLLKSRYFNGKQNRESFDGIGTCHARSGGGKERPVIRGDVGSWRPQGT